ncbi:peptidylprolyl isomerase [Thalassotalea sp. LPB0316]|uniref:peptidylprolyl isomerase n=1 Tax=Thalassotalea sp. LPB0316 TaxID=2769490 RepID=UPI0018663410|nr:peptidylprolyl isomerase [Thalassotalea sp. LPB0316]QOL26992.1 peptidylprolyl isomerase [Thalassotalea sp. LPB0316]
MARILILIGYLFTSMVMAKNVAIDPNNLFPQVKLETSKGTIVVELDRIKAPITVDNFLTYVVTGEYNNTIFHRVIEGFVVQGGGYDKNYVPRKVGENIVNESGNGLKNQTYTIAMAKEHRPHTANRQFFFNMADNTNLDPGINWGYAVFGAVTQGEEVLEEIAKQKTDFNAELGWEDVPVEPIILIKATLLPAV